MGRVLGGSGAGQIGSVLQQEEDFSNFLHPINVLDTNDFQKLLFEPKSFIHFYQ